MISRLARLAAASLLGVAAAVVVPVASASAAVCDNGTGISVVVGNDVRCDAGGAGKVAAANFTGVGHSLTYVTTEPGFVCQVDNAPASDCSRTPPSSAYWALWWSDGTSGSWVYSSRGAGTLKVPAGGFVAFVFGNGKSAPGVSPVAAAAPTAAPTTSKPSPPTATPTAKQTTRAPKPTATARRSSTPQPAATASSPTTSPSTATPSATTVDPSATPAPDQSSTAPAPSAATPSAAEPGDDVAQAADRSSGSSMSLWAGVAIAVALLAGMGGMVWRRRTQGGHDS